MGAAVDITGLKFGRLTAIRRTGSDKHKKAVWLFECECGNRNEYTANLIKGGKQSSCGCKKTDSNMMRKGKPCDALVTHGMTNKPEYVCWRAMRSRCNNPKNTFYYLYGGRGIRVCEEWQNDFASFFLHIGPKPTSRHSIDRIDNDKGYEPGNVRWATTLQQRMNQRRMKNGNFA